MIRKRLKLLFCSFLFPALSLAEQAGSGAYNPTEASIAQFEKRIAQNSSDFISLFTLSSLYARAGRERQDALSAVKALETAKQAQTLNPEYLPGKIQLASELATLHRFKEALSILDSVLKSDPKNLSALSVQSDCLLAIGELDRAEKITADLKKYDNSDPAILAREAQIVELKGDLKRAEALLKKAEQEQRREGDFQSELVWYLLRLGELKFHQGDFDSAEKWYEAALKAWPQSIPARDRVAELTAARGRFDDAIMLYKTLLNELPSPELHQALGDLLVFAGKTDEASQYLDKALTMYEKSVNEGQIHYLHHLANFYSDSRLDPVKALHYAKLDLEQRASVGAHDALAWALYKNGEYGNAREEAKKALSSGTKDAHILFHAGTIFSAAGDFEEGKRLLKEMVKINPRYNSFHAHR